MLQTKHHIQYKLIFAATCLTALFFAYLAFAAFGTNCLKECEKKLCDSQNLQSVWPTSPFGGIKLTSCSKLGELVKYLYGWGVSLGGIAVFIALVIAGFEYITSIGNPGKMKEAIDRITSAAIGLALLLGSYAIFNLINPSITTLKGNFEAIEYAPGTTCNSPADCCKEKDDCSFTDFNCCPQGDIKCMQSKDSKWTPKKQNSNSSQIDNGKCCCENNAKKSGFCNPTTNQCDDPQPVCTRTFNQPDLGCDVVKFFESPNFSGTEKTVPSDDFNKDGFTAIDFMPKSYQAYRYKTNKDGDRLDKNGEIAEKYEFETTGIEGDPGNDTYTSTGTSTPYFIPCGPASCGCAVALCFQWESGSTAHCTQDNRDPETQAVNAQAYNKDYTDSDHIVGYMIHDESKVGLIGQAISGISASVDYLKSIIWQ